MYWLYAQEDMSTPQVALTMSTPLSYKISIYLSLTKMFHLPEWKLGRMERIILVLLLHFFCALHFSKIKSRNNILQHIPKKMEKQTMIKYFNDEKQKESSCNMLCNLYDTCILLS